MKEFIETGKIVNIHGLRGEVKIMPWSDDPEFICEFDILYLGGSVLFCKLSFIPFSIFHV